MIRINKPAKPPRILHAPNSRGVKKTSDIKAAYDAGDRSFEFDASIYGAKSVKNAIVACQAGKCCFCESKITHIDCGDVEHFRPKAGFRQRSSDMLTRPGYYWLTYDWSNLFLSCTLCNQRFKRNFFPLVDSSKRATSHHRDVHREKPLFIDPTDDDPEKHIGFHQEVAYPIDDNRRAKETINHLGLNRVELIEMRRDFMHPLLLLARGVQQLAERKMHGEALSDEETTHCNEVRELLEDALLPSRQYSSMMKHALRERAS